MAAITMVTQKVMIVAKNGGDAKEATNDVSDGQLWAWRRWIERATDSVSWEGGESNDDGGSWWWS